MSKAFQERTEAKLALNDAIGELVDEIHFHLSKNPRGRDLIMAKLYNLLTVSNKERDAYVAAALEADETLP
jgi:hypothetical protein